MEAEKVLKKETASFLKEHAELLRPETLWKWFLRVTEIPRGSGNTQRLAQELVAIARQMGLESRTDATGNVCVAIPATPGLESLPKTILQCHMDMVVEHKSEARPVFNAAEDGIIPEFRGDDRSFLYAKGTSLGADDGIGIATCLAVMEHHEFEHGGIDCLFTVDEETTMVGATNVQPSLLSEGVRYLVNVDSEDDGMLCLGSAGGENVTVRATPPRTATDRDSEAAVTVSLGGLKGGHTGCEIHKYRANALKELCSLLYSASRRGGHDLRISTLAGGTYTNAITLSARATVVLARDQVARFKAALGELFDVHREDHGEIEDRERMELVVDAAAALPETALSASDSADVLRFWVLAPCQPLRMSPSIEGFVESSCAWCVGRVDADGLLFEGLARTSRESSWDALETSAAALAAVVHGELLLTDKFPGWLPCPSSTLAQAAVKAHENVAGKPPVVYSVHAGLECGIIMGNVPGLEAVSIGPLVQAPHTTDERVGISTVATYFDWVCEILRLLTAEDKKRMAH